MHRTYAILATKLAKVGQHVLRFDYYATGDSSGTVHAGSHTQWLQDVLEAHEELLGSSGASRMTWVGLRYGATLAMLASQRLRRAISGLIAWEPIVLGSAYLAELERAHADFMRRELRDWCPSPSSAAESLGFPLGPELRSALTAIDLTTAPRPKTRQFTVVTANSHNECASLKPVVSAWGEPAQWLETASGLPWNSDDAMNASVVPTHALDAIVARIEESP